MKKIHFQNTDVQWMAGAGNGLEEGKILWLCLNQSGHRSLVETEPSFPYVCLEDEERRQGQGTRKVSNIFGAPTLNQAPYTSPHLNRTTAMIRQKESEVQRDQETCRWSHVKKAAELGFRSKMELVIPKQV